MRRALLALLSMPLLAASLQAGGPGAGSPLAPEARRWVEEQLAGMSLEEQVGQLIVGGASTRFTNLGSPEFRQVRENVTRYHLGGYHAFGGEVYSAAFLIRRIQDLSRVPLLITSDLEGGTGLMLRGGTRLPRAMALGATFDPGQVRQAAALTAREARVIGIHMTFSPVADVNSNPLNPIINIRSFGEDPTEVGRMTAAYVEGIQQEGLLATAKHFPGHGDTATDSHTRLPVLEASRERLDRVELPPFRAAIEAGVGGIMVAHLAVPAVDGRRDLPATLSPAVVTGLLRGEMGFQGLVFTDALNMGGLSGFGAGEASVRALEAGADVILYPSSIRAAFQALLGAVRDGRVPPSRLAASVRRMLEAKARLGLHRGLPADLMEIDRQVGDPGSAELARSLMEGAITLVRNGGKDASCRPAGAGKELLLTVLDERRFRESRGEALVREFRRRRGNVRHVEVLPETALSRIELGSAALEGVDAILVAVYVRVAAEKEALALSPRQSELLAGLADLPVPVRLAIFGSPYLLTTLPPLGCALLAYDDHPGAERAVVRAVLGEIRPRGRLPVSLSEALPAGHGLGR